QPSGLELMADIARAEHAGGEGDEGGERDEYDVEIIDEQVVSRVWPLGEEQRQRCEKGREAREHVDPRGCAIAGKSREQCCGSERDDENGDLGIECQSHRRSPRKRSSAWTSTVSKRSRMRNRKMPITMKAMRMEKAMLISTTSGIPLAPVAARTSPFSSDMKPTTWLTALRRVTIIKSPSRTTASAKARSSRASRSASAVTLSMMTIESATSAMPASMVRPTPPTVSISRWMPRRWTMRWSTVGMTIALKTSAIAAVTKRCGAC